MEDKNKAPEGKFMSTVKVGEKGQIVIPKGARDLFGIKPGDTLLLLADTDRGIAIMKSELFEHLAHGILRAEDKPKETDE